MQHPPIKSTTNIITQKAARRPLIDPLLLLLKSRRVIVALSALLVGALTLAVPELEAVRGELLTLLLTLALAVIGGYSIEDAARAARESAGMQGDDLRDLITEIITDVITKIR